MVDLDLDFVRAQFPAFADPRLADWAHLENAGGSYVPRQVVDPLTDFFVSSKVQPYYDGDPSRRAGAAMDRAYASLPATLGTDRDHLVIGPSTSQNTYVLSQAYAQLLAPGDEVVVTEQDHEANIGSWRRLERVGAVVKEWRVDPVTGLLDLDGLRALLTERTRLVAVTHASNLAATVNPVREIADLVHAVGGKLVVDGVSYAPHAAIDAPALGCDVYLYSAYKTYGPHLGLMYVRDLDAIPNQGHFFNEGKPTYRLSPAGPDHAEIAAAAGIVDYYRAVHAHHLGEPADDLAAVRGAFELFTAYEQTLMTPLGEFLAGRDGVRLIGSPSTDHAVRAPTFGFWPEGRPAREVYDALVAAGINAAIGNCYAYRLVRALGLEPDESVVRLSLVHYNSATEVDRALEVLDSVL